MTFIETLDEIRGAYPFKSWFNQAEVARLIGEPVEQVVEYCRLGWLEARGVMARMAVGNSMFIVKRSIAG